MTSTTSEPTKAVYLDLVQDDIDLPPEFFEFLSDFKPKLACSTLTEHVVDFYLDEEIDEETVFFKPGYIRTEMWIPKDAVFLIDDDGWMSIFSLEEFIDFTHENGEDYIFHQYGSKESDDEPEEV